MITYPIIVLGFFILYLLNSIKILREYERGVIFRLGRLLPKANSRPQTSFPQIPRLFSSDSWAP